MEQQQGLTMFSDPRFWALHPTTVRLIVAWNAALLHGAKSVYADQWYADAETYHLQPLISFGALYTHYPPSLKKYRQAIQAAVKRWPLANFEAWNESDNPSQPTFHQPILAAEYGKAMVEACQNKCLAVPITITIVQSNYTVQWLRAFLKAYGTAPSIWAIHTYGDVNRRNNRELDWFMKTYKPKDVWVTETGAWEHFNSAYPSSVPRQTKATPYVLDPAILFPNIVQRVYYYEWQAPSTREKTHWDTALINAWGHARPAYYILLHQLEN